MCWTKPNTWVWCKNCQTILDVSTLIFIACPVDLSLFGLLFSIYFVSWFPITIFITCCSLILPMTLSPFLILWYFKSCVDLMNNHGTAAAPKWNLTTQYTMIKTSYHRIPGPSKKKIQSCMIVKWLFMLKINHIQHFYLQGWESLHIYKHWIALTHHQEAPCWRQVLGIVM